MPFTRNELDAMDRATERRVALAEFRAAHPEYEDGPHPIFAAALAMIANAPRIIAAATVLEPMNTAHDEVTAEDCEAQDDMLAAVSA